MTRALAAWLLMCLSAAAEEGLHRIEKDRTDYALWRIPVAGVPAAARYVQFEARFPEGTVFNVYVGGGKPFRIVWMTALGDTFFGDGWRPCVCSFGPFPGTRGWLPKRGDDVLVFPASQCNDRMIPTAEQAACLMGAGPVEPARFDSIEVELLATNGWTGGPRKAAYEVRGVRFTQMSPREESLAARPGVAVTVRLDKDLGPINPIWKDACCTSESFKALGQRMDKVFGAATFGPSYAPQDGPQGKYTWWGADAQVDLARRSASVIQVVIGRDAPPWLWPAPPPGEDLTKGMGPWKRGHLCPPKDLAAYEDIVFHLVQHLDVEKGFAVHSYLPWGGANSRSYFLGTLDEFIPTYAACARAVRRADPKAKVGGPSPDPLFDADWVREFVKRCAKEDLPVDFVSLHNYSLYADQSRRMVEWTRALLKGTPNLRDAEIHVDEWNSGFASFLVKAQTDFKEGVSNAAYAAATFGELTEAGTSYACYSSPMEVFGLVGTRLERADGTPLPIYDAFRLFSMLEGRRCQAAADRPDSGVGALAALDGGRVRAALWAYAAERQPSDVPIPLRVSVRMEGVPGADGARTVHAWRIDEAHSNLALGKAHAALERGDDLKADVKDGRATVEVPMTLPSVVLIEME